MKCQNCGKNNANVRYTQVINGDKLELFLCDECAGEMNIGLNFDFGMNDVFSSFFDEFTGIKTFAMPEVTKCQNCGLTYDEFSKTGMVGCSDCYNNFSTRLDNVLNRIHGSNRHFVNVEKQSDVLANSKKQNGVKADKNSNENSQVDKLKAELKICIENEEYEKAAVLRDKIKKIKQCE